MTKETAAVKAKLEAEGMRNVILNALPQNVTNGDVIKAMFKGRDLSVITERLEHTHWWNTPYKGGESEKV